MEKKIPFLPEEPFLPEDIIINILKFLPVKSLKRFQCVCEHWKNLFKTPSFIQLHLHHSTHQTSSLIVGQSYSDCGNYLWLFNSKMQFREFKFAPPFIDSLDDLSINASCNGLLCLLHWDDHKHRFQHLLWNPATREIKRIPVCNSKFYNSELDDVALDWNLGFGFSSIINDYKLVRIFETEFEICGVGVFSLRDGFWRHIPFDNIKYINISSQSVTANGFIFWRGCRPNNRDVIVSFDLVTEVFEVIPLPFFTCDLWKLAVYDDKLAIIFYDNAHSPHFSLYYGMYGMMEEGAIVSSGERWSSSKEYIGNFDSTLFPETFWRNQIVSVDIGMENARRLYLIDVIANEYRQFDIPKFKHGCDSGLSIFNYVESLVPLKGKIKTKQFLKDYY